MTINKFPRKIDWTGTVGSPVLEQWLSNVDRVIFDVLGNPDLSEIQGQGSGGTSSERHRGNWDMSIKTFPEGQSPLELESNSQLVVTKINDDSYTLSQGSGQGTLLLDGEPKFAVVSRSSSRGNSTIGSGKRTFRVKSDLTNQFYYLLFMVHDSSQDPLQLFLASEGLPSSINEPYAYSALSYFSQNQSYGLLSSSTTSGSLMNLTDVTSSDLQILVTQDFDLDVISANINGSVTSVQTDFLSLPSGKTFEVSVIGYYLGDINTITPFSIEFDISSSDPLTGGTPFTSGPIAELIPPAGTVDGDIFKIVNPARYLDNAIPINGSHVKITNNLQTILEWRVTPPQTGLETIADGRISAQCAVGGTIDLKVKASIQEELADGGSIKSFVQTYVAEILGMEK